MIWNYIRKWFGDLSERNRIINNFNENARTAFIRGETPIFMEASISFGNGSYKHAFSKMRSGFRIKALSGRGLSRDEMLAVANVILDDDELSRELMTLGWDTLEVYGDLNSTGLQFNLSQKLLSY